MVFPVHIFGKRFRSLDKAQHECIRNNDCGAVYGTDGNEFRHTIFQLGSAKYAKIKNRKSFFEYHADLPNSMYIKPGID